MLPNLQKTLTKHGKLGLKMPKNGCGAWEHEHFLVMQRF